MDRAALGIMAPLIRQILHALRPSLGWRWGSLLVATALLHSLESGVRAVRWAIGLGPDPARAGPNGLSERASRRGLVKSSGGYGSSFTVAAGMLVMAAVVYNVFARPRSDLQTIAPEVGVC